MGQVMKLVHAATIMFFLNKTGHSKLAYQPNGTKILFRHSTVDLLFDWFGISCIATDIFLFLFAKQTNPNQSNRRSGAPI